jgi:uncharacterized protein (DUF305 family)
MHRARKTLLVPALLTVALGLSACGSSDGSAAPAVAGVTTPATISASTPSADGHNQHDVEFATGMIPHHAQAIEMSKMVLARTKNATVKALATRIEAAQSPEITTLSGWLKGWGEPVPDTSMSMDGGMSMDGMMSHADMRKLEKASASTVDGLFLAQMVKHHRGAITMAEDEIALGADPQAKQLAEGIKKAQTAEVAEMKALRN